MIFLKHPRYVGRKLSSDRAGIPLFSLWSANIQPVQLAGNVAQAPALPLPIGHELHHLRRWRLYVSCRPGDRGGLGSARIA